MRLRYYIFSLILLISTNLLAQFTPYFKNYTLSQYNAGNQNWGISLAENGKVYVANNSGLLEYDGLKWDFMQLPNKTIIRSVLAYKDLIYTGSYEEFGVWKKNSKGQLVYTSLSYLIENEKSENEEYWQIMPYNDGIVFRSFSNVYIYRNNKITNLNLSFTIISCSVVNDKLYVATLKNGIFVLENETLISSIVNPNLYDTEVMSITNYDGNLLLITALKGCFMNINNVLTPWNSAISNLIKEHQLDSFTQLNNGNMVFGTIKNGVYITDHFGKVIYHINKENGLINNTVLSQGLDKVNTKLWLGLDNGLAYVDLNSHNLFFNDYSGKLGGVYDIIEHNNLIYIGSNTGLFYLDLDYNLKFIEDSQGQVWDLQEINGELYCGHNNGSFLVKNNMLHRISEFTGGWTIKKKPESPNTFIQGTYSGLVEFKNNNGQWETKHLGETTIPIKYLEFEDPFTIWVAHAYKGVFKIILDRESGKIDKIIDYQDKGLWSNYNVRINKIKNDICFKTNDGWQKYEPLLDSIIPHNLINESLGNDAYLISDSNSDQIVVRTHNQINFKSLIDNNYNLTLTNRFFENRLIVGSEKISKINDSIYALALYNGFMLIDSKNHTKKVVLQEPIIEKVTVDKNLIDIDSLQIIESPYNKNVSISISLPKSDDHFFEYSISSLDSVHWSKMDNEKLNLSSLNNGDYKILFRAVNSSGDISPSKTVKLKILAPWYESGLGALLYTLMAILISILIFKLHKRKIDKEQKILQQKFEEEQREILKEKALESEKKIIQFKNESLKNEIKLKSKQLANTAMSLVKKNESMLEIKNELIQNKINFDNNYSYKKLLKKIDNSIGHEDEWELFEYNFNQVHEEFFNKLKTKSPNLTHKDLKICAYIKMNLLTKEIAPLMNISTRGVETHRFRLKRKLNIERDKSLTDFLLNIK